MSYTYTIDNAYYKTKIAVERDCKLRLRQNGNVILQKGDANFQFFYDIFQLHSCAKRRDVHKIHIEMEGGAYHMAVENGLGEKRTISYKTALLPRDKQESSQGTKLTSAMRFAVYPITKQYSVENKNKLCQKCKQFALKMEVDHIFPFSKMRDIFLETHTPPATFAKGYRGSDIFEEHDPFATEWLQFHNSYANNLQMLCQSCNGTKSNF